MSRIRSIHPRAPQDEDVASMSIWARYLWAFLPCYADRDGRLEDRPLMLKGEVFPADSVDVNELLNEMANASRGFIIRYRDKDGRKLIQIVHFNRYQKPHHKERVSVLQPPDGWESVGQNPGEMPSIDDESDNDPEEKRPNNERSDNDRSGSLDLRISGSPVLNTNTSSKGGQAELLPITAQQTEDSQAEKIRKVVSHYRAHHPRACRALKSTSVEWKKIKARLEDGYSVDDLCLAIDGYHKHAWHVENGQLMLELMMRDDSHVSAGIGWASQANPPGSRQSEPQRATPILEW